MGFAHGYLYTCEISILRAINVPVSDLNDLSSDPYVRATLSAVYGSSVHAEVSQLVTFRTHTERRTLKPTFNENWVVSGIPISGFTLTLHLRDEDPRNHDDHLGKSVLQFPPQGQEFKEGWTSGEIECKVHKRNGSVKSKITTFIAKVLSRGKVDHHCRICINVKVLSRADDQQSKRLYTVGPHRYFQHFSPLLGYMLGSLKAPNIDPDNPSLRPTSFVANRLQLTGPVPPSLRHRYVGFAPFVKAMFKKQGIKGILLHRALHKQHCSIYRWDKNVVWGVIDNNPEVPQELQNGDHAPPNFNGDTNHDDSNRDTAAPRKSATQSLALARQLLRMTSHGTHGRIFTYVIMLDGEWRFTETSEGFAIQFLSKHTMHSDVAVEIAYSGEFFVRLLHPHGTDNSNEPPPSDPALYELVIDNDSGTYRPRKDLLPVLQSYLSSPANLGAFGKITAMDGFDEKLKEWKKDRAELKVEMAKGKGKAVQASLSSSSSNSSSSSVSVNSDAGVNSPTAGLKVTESDVQNALEEDANRARENQDRDLGAKEEEDAAEKVKTESRTHEEVD